MTEQNGNMSISSEEVFSILTQIDEAVNELITVTQSVHEVAMTEDQQTDGKSAPIHSISNGMAKEVSKVQGLTNLMADVRTFLKSYASKADEANDASAFNTEG